MTDHKNTTTGRQAVLGDHKRVGKRFIPPFLSEIGPLSEVSWVNEVMPELIWIGVLIDEYDYRRGIAIGLELSKSAVRAYQSERCEFFAWTSDYERLSQEQREALVGDLKRLGGFSEISRGLRLLLSLYPDCPLGFLTGHSTREQNDDLQRMTSLVGKLYARRDVFATQVQAAAVYYAFIAGRLKAVQGTSLASFPEIEKYSATDESRRVASSICALVNGLYGNAKEHRAPTWPLNFWNRGLSLEGCRSVTDASE